MAEASDLTTGTAFIHLNSQSSSFLVALMGLNAAFLKFICCDSSASTLSFCIIRKKWNALFLQWAKWRDRTWLLTHSDLNPNADHLPACLFVGKNLASILNKFSSMIGKQRAFFKQENSNLIFNKNIIIFLLFLFAQEQQGLKIACKMEYLTLLCLWERLG